MVLGISASWEEWRAAKRAKARSDDIDRQIKEEDKTFKKCDVLLMGSWPFTVSGITWTDFVLAGVNGPTTLALFRQMKILYNDGYSHKELVDFRLSIWRYLLETSRRIVQDLRNVGLEPANHANKVRLFLFRFFARHVLIPLLYRLTASAFWIIRRISTILSSVSSPGSLKRCRNCGKTTSFLCCSSVQNTTIVLITRLSESSYYFFVAIEPHTITI